MSATRWIPKNDGARPVGGSLRRQHQREPGDLRGLGAEVAVLERGVEQEPVLVEPVPDGDPGLVGVSGLSGNADFDRLGEGVGGTGWNASPSSSILLIPVEVRR